MTERIVYVTSSSFKREENKVLTDCTLEDGTRVGELFWFQFRGDRITETLVVDLEDLVRAEARAAYAVTKVPCIVEHAGLVFDGQAHYPGGLTKPMWDALGDQFVVETHMDRRRAVARAVVGYCDGQSVHTFKGETSGTLVHPPRGARKFYWDRVFVPDDPPGKAAGKTYAEIVEDPALGLPYKMQHLSQSARAMRKFLEFRRTTPLPDFWQ
jgi:inosine/xanthosine triphosphate pyrophosphatase family protein